MDGLLGLHLYARIQRPWRFLVDYFLLNQLVQTYPDEKYAGKASSLLNDIEGKTPPVPEQTPDTIEEPSQG